MSTITKEFATAGRAVFTLEVPTTFQELANARPHYTYRVTKKDASEKWGDAWFVALLTGPDNEASYSYLGMLDPASGSMKLTRGSKLPADSVPVKLVQRVFARVWEGNLEPLHAAGFDLHHEGKCGRCGRTLTVPESIECGIGPECQKIMGM